jgi:hypothetical protein
MGNSTTRDQALKLRTLIGGAWLTQAISLAAKLKLADLLNDQPKPIDELAEKTGTKADRLYRLLRALASQEIFEEKEPRIFSNTMLSRFLRSGTAGSLRNVALFYGDQTYLAFEHFENQLRTGEVAYVKRYGADVFSNLGRDSERFAVFNNAMAELCYEQAGAILDAYDFSGINMLCDIGGGNGSLLAAVLERHSKLNGILVDLPEVIGIAKQYFSQRKLHSRVSAVGGDFFKPLNSRADACMMKYIIHDWPDEKALQILRNCKEVAPKILVIEQMIPPGNDPLFGKMSDLMMMTSFGSGERTQGDFQRLFDLAGLKIKKIHSTDYLLSIFELETH